MAALVIFISSDVYVESVGSSFLRVILIGSISIEVPVVPEVGVAAVASPVRVLELDTHSSSEADPLESSPPPVFVAPMVSPFLCSDDSESDTDIPERHVTPTTSNFPEIPTAPILPTPSTIVAPSSEALTVRKSVRPSPSHRLALRYTSYHLDHFTSGSSSSHSSLDHSPSGHSISGHSLSRHTPPDTTDADSSTPSRFIHPSLARAPRCSEAYLRWRSAKLSTMYPPMTSESSAGDSSFESSAGPSRKRCRSPAATVKDIVEEDIDMDVLDDIKADATANEVVVDIDIEAGIDAGELANSITIQEPRTQQCQRSQLTIDRETKKAVADIRLKSLRKKKQPVAGEGSSAAHNKYYDTNSDATLYSSSLDKTEEVANETDDADESDMDLSDDNPQGDNDAARYGVFMHNKSTPTPNSTYLGLMVTSSSLDFIQTLLDETPVNELMDFMSHPVYTDAQTTSVVNNLKGNPKLTSYISCASEVPIGTHVDVLATKMLLQEMFPNENAYHLSSPPATKTSYPTTYPQPSSLQAKAKKLMQKAKKNMRKINFKKAVAQKFKEYDQKLNALTNFNLSEAFEKAVQAKVLTEIKKLLPTHIPKVIANYVRPRLNTSVLDFPKKSGSANAKRRTTWFDLFLKSDIDQNENHILAPSSVAIANKIKAIIKKDKLTIADLEVRRFDDKEYEFSYANLPRLSLNNVEDMYLLQVQDKLHHLPLELVKYFNNALLLIVESDRTP
ncbi:hypothetical protein Tco_1052660 [Tanacetum coccineum]